MVEASTYYFSAFLQRWCVVSDLTLVLAHFICLMLTGTLYFVYEIPCYHLQYLFTSMQTVQSLSQTYLC